MKSLHFSLEIRQTILTGHERREALFLLPALLALSLQSEQGEGTVLAHTLLTLLGKAGFSAALS